MTETEEKLEIAGNTASARVTRVCFLMLAFLICLWPVNVFALDSIIKIGVLANRGYDDCLKRWGPTAAYLTDKVHPHTFRIVPLSFEEIKKTVENQKVDFVICNPGIYVEMEALYGVSRIATIRTKALDDYYSIYGGVIFVRANNQTIKTIEDLKGKRFAAVDKDSFGGWLAAWRELNRMGIDPSRDFKSLVFIGQQDQVVYNILSGKADAGTVRTDILENMSNAGRIRLQDIRVLPAEGIDVRKQYGEFPFLLSTRLYPEWPIAKLMKTPTDLATRITVALMSMDKNDPAAVAAQSGGWSYPMNYQVVHDLMMELKIGYYGQLKQATPADILKKYWREGLVALLVLLVISGALIQVLRLNRRLTTIRKKLDRELIERKKIQTEIQKSEEQVRLFLDSTGEAIYGVDLAGNCTIANRSCLKMLGYRGVEQLLGQNMHRLIHHSHPDGRPLPAEDCRIYQAFREGRAVHVEDEFLWKADGTCFPAELWSYPKIENGQVTGAVVTFVDITERKQAQELLAMERRRLSNILEGTNVGTWEWNIQTGEVVFNERWAQMIGYKLSELEPVSIGTWMRFTHPDDLKMSNDLLEKHFRKELPYYECEARMRHKNGSWIWVLDRGKVAKWTEDGKPLLMSGTHLDINDRKRAEEALKQSEEKYRTILGEMDDIYFEVDLTGNYTFLNDASFRVMGYAEQEMIGTNYRRYLSEDDSVAVRSAFQQIYRSGRPERGVPYKVINKDGTISFAEISSFPMKNQAGEMIGFRGIVRDISERKRAEEELLKMNAELVRQTEIAKEMAAQAQMASAAKSEFLANMSHEIRTPMNGVIGMIGLLLGTEMTGEQRHYAETVHSSAESLLGLINDILDLSKIEAGKLDLEIMDFDLENLLDDFAAAMAIRAQDKGLELLCAADPGIPMLLRGDPGRLRQILTNMVGNAIKFTKKGEVAIRVEQLNKTKRSDGRTKEDDIRLRFSVRDTGIGIPKEKLAMLFTKFTQVDASTSREYGGTGLGLAISRQLAELMGGEAGVTSEGGRGSEFWFIVRLGRQMKEAREEKILPADLQDVRVLIVDDNETNREILNGHLALWGMRPAQAPDGPAALQALNLALEENDPFRIALIDMQMPGMDGKTLGLTIKADERLAGTRMVMLTSMGQRGDTRQFAEAGFVAYLNKPMRHQELKDVLSMVLADSRTVLREKKSVITRHSIRELSNLFAGSKARILLAEDNIVNQQVALGILKKLGLQADAVASGTEAISALETLPYDLVFMDVQMPVMDGLVATRMIRNPQSRVRNHTIPVIAMTAFAMSGDREKCLAAGMDDYVAKPVTPLALAGMLEKWLPKKGDGKEPVKKQEREEAETVQAVQTVIWDKAGMMDRLMDDEELAGAILNGFLKDTPRQIENLKASLSNGDLRGAEHWAHTIKGETANIGGERLRAVAFEMEKEARAGNPDGVKARMAQMEARFEQLKEMIKAESGMVRKQEADSSESSSAVIQDAQKSTEPGNND